MYIGFTGTQRGMTSIQKQVVLDILLAEGAWWVSHGDCVGADAEFHEIAHAIGLRVHIRPPLITRKRAFCELFEGDVSGTPLPYLERNRAIVDDVGMMLAAPGEPAEQLRSGTWSTIRYANRIGRPCTVVLPDGERIIRI